MEFMFLFELCQIEPDLIVKACAEKFTVETTPDLLFSFNCARMELETLHLTGNKW
jgi:hypothetical protein